MSALSGFVLAPSPSYPVLIVYCSCLTPHAERFWSNDTLCIILPIFFFCMQTTTQKKYFKLFCRSSAGKGGLFCVFGHRKNNTKYIRKKWNCLVFVVQYFSKSQIVNNPVSIRYCTNSSRIRIATISQWNSAIIHNFHLWTLVLPFRQMLWTRTLLLLKLDSSRQQQQQKRRIRTRNRSNMLWLCLTAIKKIR